METTFTRRQPPMEDDLQWKTTLRGKINSKHTECDLGVLKGNLEKGSVEISSMALLSPACFLIILSGQCFLTFCDTPTNKRARAFPVQSGNECSSNMNAWVGQNNHKRQLQGVYIILLIRLEVN